MEHPRVIIVMTTPYSRNNSSRSLDAYFHFWEHDRVRQIFSRNWKPQKGHCGELFQITDAELLKCRLHRLKDPGTVYKREDLEDSGHNETLEEGSVASKSYSIGRKHSPSVELLRGMLWNKKYWCSEKLIKWLDDYRPELIFYNFTNNLFLQKIVLFLAERYRIPVVSAIGDDYYFSDRKSISPAYNLFRRKFKASVRKVFEQKGSAVYVCDGIRDRYNAEFGLDGETVYFCSSVERRPFRPINDENPVISYFGNIRIGRYKSILKIADSLLAINSDYRINVYSNEQDEEYTSALKDHPGVVFHGEIPYDEVQLRIKESDIYVVTEDFDKSSVDLTKYSVSTKVADGLMCGTAVLAFGPEECGAIKYLKETGGAAVCSDDSQLKDIISKLIADEVFQREIYDSSAVAAGKNHSVNGSCAAFENVVRKALAKN